jgi:DNA mismatch endonuclease (patch repair protein)|tara:strand:+ start:2005 stop:2409 length:405 start_codon:yes stop_codon:yes gene_type:complete
MDIWSKEKRSQVMSNIRSIDTKPELLVRSLLHQAGYRFRIHRKDLPGKPDIVLPKYKAVVFVHGCFWHLHSGCRDGTVPKTRADYWKNKLLRNKERDKEHMRTLQKLGWRVLRLWECEVEKETDKVLEKLNKFL